MEWSRHIKRILTLLVTMALFACTHDDYLPSADGEEATVTFCPSIDNAMNTRAIGDATGIDQLVIAVYEGSETKRKVHTQTTAWQDAQKGISLRLIEGRTYHIIFWARHADNTAYTLTDDGMISVNYSQYQTGGFSMMEQMDAFYATAEVTVGATPEEDKGTITLTRPLAQVNFADATTKPVTGTHKAVVTFHGYPTSYNPFSGEVTISNEDIAFTFTDFPNESLNVDNTDYHYLSSNYLFVPRESTATFKATLDLQNAEGTSIKTVSLDNVTVEKNKKTNVTGSIVQEPETWSVWDGELKSQPTTDSQNRYIIDEASDIAWLTENGTILAANSTFLQTKDIDMDSKEIASIALPKGSIYDGGEKTIKNYNNSLFGDATTLTVQNLVVDNVTAIGTTHVGTLVNTLKGTSSFSNITVSNSSATTTNGAAGGLVGYVVRTSEKERTETLEVSFSNCKLNGITVSGSASEGKFVGLLSGYDNNESLTFDAGCDATDVTVANYTSVYTKANNSAWVTSDVTDKYDGWLGHETYRRGKVEFNGVRLVPRWDGKTVTASANLLLHNNKDKEYEVYSPFDLAGVRKANASPTALYLMENVDMYGQGADGKYFVHSNFTQSKNESTDDNNFDAFSSIAFLEGNNNGIYNVALNSKGSDRYAFILNGADGNIHQNVSFHNCCTVVPHIVNKDNEDKSYGATVVLSINGATYTMDNVHAYGCKVFALQKTGVIAGRVTSLTMATIKNCSVNNCYIENYNCKDHAEAFGSGIISTTFYTPGEVGGFIGFVENFATISNCHVKGTTIYAFGQDNKKLFYIYTVYGRHVGQFIGDIRTSDKEKDKIVLTNCTVDSNTKCTKRWDKHGKCNMVGCVYNLPLLDTKGTVTLDGKSIF